MGAGLGLALLAACAGPPAPVESAPSAPVQAAELKDEVFDVGYGKIAEVYFQPIDLGQLTVDGLSGLSAIDPRLAARRQGDRVELLFDGAPVDAFVAPAPGDTGGWAALTVEAVRSGQTVSQPLYTANAEAIYEAVFNGIVADLDEYSRYVNASRAEQERASRDGYGGIGLVIDLDENGQTIVGEVFPHGPADRAGIAAGDIILAVDGESTAGWTLESLGSHLRGPVSSLVRVTLQRGTDVRTLAVEREHVVANSVETSSEDGIVILRISRFNAATAEQAAAALDAALEQLGGSAVGVILDLRGNPGGLLDQSVALADLFIPGGQIISTRGRHPDSMQYYSAGLDDLARGLPLIVLVDGRSASGAEVVAAALQDTGRAVVIGASSYGKGSVQTVTRLPNSGELFLTWSRIYGPAGYTIHRQGVLPSICTSGSETDPSRLVDTFRTRDENLPVKLSPWRELAADDDEALAVLRAACPWHEHDASLDVQVAKRVLLDGALYAEAVSGLAGEALAQR